MEHWGLLQDIHWPTIKQLFFINIVYKPGNADKHSQVLDHLFLSSIKHVKDVSFHNISIFTKLLEAFLSVSNFTNRPNHFWISTRLAPIWKSRITRECWSGYPQDMYLIVLCGKNRAFILRWKYFHLSYFFACYFLHSS